ncbi:aggregation-promoting factor C-terminal-like domain-containing protein [Arthrobacter sp. NPDC055138]
MELVGLAEPAEEPNPVAADALEAQDAEASDHAAAEKKAAQADQARQAAAEKKAAAAKAAAKEAADRKAAEKRAAAEAAKKRAAAQEAAQAKAAKEKAAAKAQASRNDPAAAKAYAEGSLASFGWGAGELGCLETLWHKESEWNIGATNPSSGAYGIPQALPGNKMAAAGADWQTNVQTQVDWGLGYIEDRYGSPCSALDFHLANNWY